MTTTSVFEGIGEGSRISSRVLKPPGGESSISFTDHDFTKRPVKYGVQETPKADVVAKEALVETPSSAKEEENGSSNESTPLEVAAPAQSPETNGTVITTNGSSDPIPSPAPAQSDAVDSSSPDSTSQKPFTNGTSNGSLHDIENGTNSISINDNDTNGTLSATAETADSVSPATNGSSEHKTKANLPPLHIKTSSSQSSSQNSPTSVSPSASSPTVSSPSAKGQDTKDRLFGQPMALSPPPVEQPQPRKIRDHMRSSIFGSDDSYDSARSSRVKVPASPVAAPEPIERPTGGQRGRVPPGGFSTKLW